ncbi:MULTISPECIES: MliC family protein [Methylobacterium]|uniref:MliC family protein n=1 Tax=Methylobacterium longum TaxID=767694 RepID=A0ABT8APG2_9HYPH|nr:MULTISPECIES: MliC family protein [Methylobacterium]MCJ2101125.1 MliC family protein [Methylobacterium sp. E-046]MDN3571742.1 MliC family protein [Methylobacterium longum]GJE11594.1 hypothetical protein FOHLNKBM_2637 [Methylobacterium longum]
MNRLLPRDGIAALLAAGLVVPAAPTRAASSTIRHVAFACPAGRTLTVAFDIGNLEAPAVVHPPGGPAVTLPVQPHADGIRYGDGRRELRGKGRVVTWSDAGKPPVTCAETPADR